MIVEDLIFLVLILPIGVIGIVMALMAFRDIFDENDELKKTIERKDKVIFEKARENKALEELLADAEQSVQVLLRERTERNESQNSCS